MSEEHHRVRYHVVEELPSCGRPLAPEAIGKALGLPAARTEAILEDLEKHLFFLVRNEEGAVTWAFPVTVTETPTTCASVPGRGSTRLERSTRSRRPSCKGAFGTSPSPSTSRPRARTAQGPCASRWTTSCAFTCTTRRLRRWCSVPRWTGQPSRSRTSPTASDKTRYSSGQKSTHGKTGLREPGWLAST